jgi:hypothetical protein
VAATGDGTITYQWQVNTNLVTPSWSNISGATSATYDAPVLNADAQYRRVATSLLNSVACTATSNMVTVTVNNLTAGSISANQTICDGGDPVAFTSVAATGDGTISYQWQVNTNIATPNWTIIGGATMATFDAGVLNADAQYRRVVTGTLNGVPCTLISNVVTVTVNNMTAGSIAGDATICSGGDPAAFTSVAATGDGTITYQWQLNTNLVTPSWSNISGATSATYDAGVLNADAQYRRIATSTQNSVACTATSNVVTVTVNNLTAGSITGDATICDGADPAAFTSVAATGDGAITYQWQVNTNIVTPSWSSISGATSATYDAAALNADAQYRRVATSTLNSVACTATSNVVTVTVNNLTAGSITGNQTICDGGDPTAFTSVASTGDGTITYQWQVNTNIATPSWSNISGATLATFDAGVLNADAQYRRVATSTLNSVACTATSNVLTVTVNNMTAGSISGDQTICDGGDPAAFTSVAATGDGTITYQWQVNTNLVTPSWSNIGGATLATFDAGVLNADAQYRRVATSTLNSVACTATSSVLTVTVNNLATGSIAGSQTICDGGDPVALTSLSPATGDGVITYQWQVNTNLVTPNWTNISGATSITFDPGVLNADVQYRRMAISTLNGVACSGLSGNTVNITVNNMTAGSIAGNQTICDGGDPAAFTSVAATGDGTITYQWQVNTNLVTPSWSNISGATSATYDAPVLNADAQYRRVATSLLNSVACTATSNVLTVAVNNMTAGSISGTATICEGTDPAVFGQVAATGDGTITYQWQVNTNIATPNWTIISGATAASYDAGVLNADAQYRRFATSTLNGVPCTLISNVVTMTVNNVTAGSISADQTICYAGNPAAFGSNAAATGDSPVTYQWESSTNNINFTAIPSATSATYDAPDGLIITTFYRRVATSVLNSVTCTATSNTLKVTVPPAGLSATVTSTNVKCFNAGDGTITVASPVGGFGTYETSIDGTNWVDVSAGAPYTFTGLVPGTYQVTMRDKTVTDCFILSTVTITQPTALTATATPSSTSTVRAGIPVASNGSTAGGAGLIKVRSGENFKLSALAAGGTIGAGYVYEWTTNASTAPVDADASAAVYEVTNAVAANSGTYTIKVTDANQCTTSVNVAVTVYDNTVWVDASAAGNNDNAGTSDAPLKTIQKGIDVTGDADAINVRAGTYNESPSLISARTITGSGSPELASDQYFIYNTGDSVTITGFTTATFNTVGAGTSDGIYKALNRVNSSGTLRILSGTYTITSTIGLYSNVTVRGVAVDMANTCDLAPTTKIHGSGASLVLFKSYGNSAKTIADLELKVADANGRFIEVASGSTANVSTEQVRFLNSSGTVLYGLTNADRSAGVVHDVAKLVNDKNDFGFGTGEVVYGKYAPLPIASVVAGWKAEDGNTATNGASVAPLYSYAGGNLVNGSISGSRPKFYTGDAAILNSRGHLRFDGTDDFLDAATTAAINGGDAKTVFVAFRTGAATANDMVVYKHGDENQGLSIVVDSDENIELNIYEEGQVATLSYAATANTNYVAQVYFNGGSADGNNTTDPRVGLAIDDADAQVAESKIAGGATGFNKTTLTTPATNVTQTRISLGGRVGSVYMDGAEVIATTRGNFFNGNIGEVVVLSTASADTRDAVYCHMRSKYLGSSGVDNDLERGREVVAGEEPSTESFLTVYPNPADQDISIEAAIPVGGDVTVTLHDMVGRQIMTLFTGIVGNNASLPMNASVRELPSGAYTIHMTGPNGLHMVTPIIVRH